MWLQYSKLASMPSNVPVNAAGKDFAPARAEDQLKRER